MNIQAYNDVTFTPIGFGCLHHSISCLLEYMDALGWALKYVYFDFIYNKEAFTEFETSMKPEEYLVPNNELFFQKKLYSKYKQAYKNCIDRRFYNSSKLTALEKISLTGCTLDEALKHLKSVFSDKSLPIILNFDTYSLRPIYLKLSGKAPMMHNDHCINVFDINFEEGYCEVIDKYFSLKGKISLETVLKAALESKGANICYYKSFDNLSLSPKELLDFLHENISISLDEKALVLDGISYYKNEKALQSFIMDFEELSKELEFNYGKYAPQHISYPLIEYRSQRQGIGALYRNINKILKNPHIEELSLLFDESFILWKSFDVVLDKIFLKNLSLTKEKDRLVKLLYSILEKENQIIKKLIDDKVNWCYNQNNL